MRASVVILVDEIRQRHRAKTIERMEIGLLDCGISAARLIPGTATRQRREEERTLCPQIEYEPQVAPWFRRWRRDALRKLLEPIDADLLHVIGRPAWPLALELGQSLSIPVLLECWSIRDVRAAPRRRRAAGIAAYVGATRALSEALYSRVDGSRIAHVPIGVAVPSEARPAKSDAETISVAMIGRGEAIAAYRAALKAIARSVESGVDLQVVLEVSGPRSHDIWRIARDLNLLDRTSIIESAEHLRDLVLQCRILLAPDHGGEVRPLFLEAMGRAIPVISVADPSMDAIHSERAVVISRPSQPSAWEDAIATLTSDQDRSESLGLSAWSWIREHHASSTAASVRADLYQRILHDNAIPLVSNR